MKLVSFNHNNRNCALKVTVITAVLNGIETIEKCIASVKEQTYSNIEHLIIDGGSNDGTVEYLEKSGISFISSPDAGVYDGINKGIMQANGELVHTLNADDYYADSNVVENVVRFFKDNKVNLCHGYVEQIDADGNHVWKIGSEVSKSQLLKKMKVAHPSVFVKIDVYKKYGSYSVGFKIAADQDFLLRVWDKIDKGFIPNTFVKMGMAGVSNTNVKLSYRESAAVSILHGSNIFVIPFNYVWQIFKHKVIVNMSRKLGYRKR